MCVSGEDNFVRLYKYKHLPVRQFLAKKGQLNIFNNFCNTLIEPDLTND